MVIVPCPSGYDVLSRVVWVVAIQMLLSSFKISGHLYEYRSSGVWTRPYDRLLERGQRFVLSIGNDRESQRQERTRHRSLLWELRPCWQRRVTVGCASSTPLPTMISSGFRACDCGSERDTLTAKGNHGERRGRQAHGGHDEFAYFTGSKTGAKARNGCLCVSWHDWISCF